MSSIVRPAFRFLAIVMLMAAVSFSLNQQAKGQNNNPLKGKWDVLLSVGDKEKPATLSFLLEVTGLGKNQAHVVNGIERIPVDTAWDAASKTYFIKMPHYASQIALKKNRHGWSGTWTKRRGKNDAKVSCVVMRHVPQVGEDPKPFLGRWSAKFNDSEDLAVGVFQRAKDSNQVLGTFLTTTGDYRFLAGYVQGGILRLTCFDGGHAFLFEIEKQADETLSGSFHSGNWYRDTWTAEQNEKAALPDAFQQTTWTGKVDLSELKFPGLDGKLVALDDERFSGKCRIIEVFGSWCPNCHDAGVYLSELQNKYGDRGLSIVGLAFELTGELEKDTAQVKTFIERNNTDYPILIAGTSDKSAATEQLQLLDRVRSYPTMIFMDQSGKVRAIYTGFNGPATGEAHAKLRSQFEKLIEGILDE